MATMGLLPFFGSLYVANFILPSCCAANIASPLENALHHMPCCRMVD
jgi:hypothetical protein